MELLYIGKNTAYQLLNDGEIKAFRIGTTWKIPRSAVDEYIIEKCNAMLPGRVEKGIFGADMKVELLNDGPFTIVLDSDQLFITRK